MQGIMETFSLALKINSHQLKFDIRVQDDQDTLFEKLKKIYPQCSNKKQQVLNKLKQDLISKVKGNTVKPELKHTIQYFLSKTFSQGTSEPYAECPTKKDKVTLSQKQKSKNSRSKQQYHSQQENLVVEYNLKKAPQYCPTFSKQLKKPESKQISRPHSQKKKQSPNEDIVKACQVIMQKTNQNDMKEMARKYLEDVGRLHSQSKRKEQIINIQNKEKEEVVQNQIPIIANQSSVKANHTKTAIPNESRQYFYRSPIAQLDRETTKPRLNIERSHEKDRLICRQAKTRSFRGNKYDYLSSIEQMQASKELVFGDSCYPSIINSGYRQKKFSYLLDFNN